MGVGGERKDSDITVDDCEEGGIGSGSGGADCVRERA
jgi:hypothetical protein